MSIRSWSIETPAGEKGVGVEVPEMGERVVVDAGVADLVVGVDVWGCTWSLRRAARRFRLEEDSRTTISYHVARR